MPVQLNTASGETTRLQEYIRFKSPLDSSGVIIEIDTSVTALAIGPESDVARVNVTYLDPSQPQAVQSIEVAVDNPFVGRLVSDNSEIYPATGSPAILLLTLADIIDNLYTPYGTAPAVSVRPVPQLDVFAYFSPPSQIPALRSDRTFLYSFVNIPLSAPQGGATYFIPYYGRRLGRVLYTNQEGNSGYTLTVKGIRLSIGDTTIGGNKSGEVLIGVEDAPLNGTVQVITRSSDDGLFDLLQVEIAGTPVFSEDMALRIDVSDREA